VRLAGPALCAASFAALAAWSWRRWADVQVDFGRELYTAWRLGAGDVLYRDLAWFNGPLSAYANALWFQLFGTGYTTLFVANAVILAIAVTLLYAVLRGAGDRVAAWAGTLTLIWIFAFQHPLRIGNYNWLSPYSHEMTHGVTLALAALWCAQRARAGRQDLWVAAAGLLLGLVFLTKVEIYLAAVLGVAVTLALQSLRSSHPALSPSRAVLGLAAHALPLTLAWALLALAIGPGGALAGLLAPWSGVFASPVSGLEYYRAGLGIDDPWANLGAMLKWSGLGVALMGSVFALNAAVRKPGPALSSAALFAAAGVAAAVALPLMDHSEVARPLPLFLLLLVGICAWAWLQSPDETARERQALRLGLLVFALALLAKMILNVRFWHYGFALAMPAMAVTALVLVGWIPEWLERRFGSGAIFRAGALALLAAIAGSLLETSHLRYQAKDQLVGEGADQMVAEHPRGRIFQMALDDVARRFPGDARVLVIPEGVTLNYLARRPSPTRYINFMPPELLLFGEDEVLRALQESPPDGVLLVHRDTSEYGFPFFGTDYGQALARWIEENYDEARVLGRPPFQERRFGIAVLTRRP
jgi:hypothetical protein